MAPKRAAARPPPSINFGSLADFLGGAIKDAGAAAQLPTDLPPPCVPVAQPVAAPGKKAAKPAAKPKTASNANTANNANTTDKSTGKPEVALDHPRKLVTLKKILRIETFNREHDLIQIEGWAIVARKTKYVQEGELVIFVETDTFLPAGKDDPWGDETYWKFAEVGNETVFEGRKGFLVKPKTYTSNDRVVLSQGHIYALSDFKNIFQDYCRRRETFGDDFGAFVDSIREIDYTSLLGTGVCKWISDAERAAIFPAPSAGGTAALNKFPGFILKTTINRLQNCPNLFEKPKYRTQVFQESLKMDGASMSIYFVSHEDMKKPDYYTHLRPLSNNGRNHTMLATGRMGVCSKERDIPFDSKIPYWQAALQQNYADILNKLGKTIVIQGELVGHNIQGNPHKYPVDTYCFFIYSIFEPEKRTTRWDPRKVERWAADHGAQHVPVYGYHNIPHIARNHEDLLIRADLHIGDEGLVFKNCADGRWFKVHSRIYLMQQEAKLAAKRGEKPLADEPIGGEDDYQGWEMPDDEFEQLIQDYEEGKLDNDPGVQAFVEEWDRKWNSKPYSTIPGRLLKSNAMGMGKKLLGFDVKEQSKSACEWLRIPGNFGQGN